MRRILLATAAISMAMTTPLLAQGKGNDKGRGKPEATQNKDKGKKADKREEKRYEAKRDDSRKSAKQDKKYKSGKREKDIREARDDYRNDRNKGLEKFRKERAKVPIDGRDVSDVFYIREDGRFRFDRDRRSTRDRDYYTLHDCPPGLAKKRNGCLPPGQAKKIDRDRFGYLGHNARYRDDDYYYSGGYAYRYNTGSNIANAILPLVGGALFGGKVWPQSYDNYRVPDYYQDYYGRNDDYVYRYADHTIFSVNQDDNAIIGIAALLTGDDFEVGQPMPAGYDVYNVPYDYRDRYYDRPEANYRYSDGYVYQVDPKTQLITAVIKLIT